MTLVSFFRKFYLLNRSGHDDEESVSGEEDNEGSETQENTESSEVHERIEPKLNNKSKGADGELEEKNCNNEPSSEDITAHKIGVLLRCLRISRTRRRRLRQKIVHGTTTPMPSEVAKKGPEGIVTVEVGPSKVKFYLHKDFLMYHCGYFRKALAGAWKEAEERLFRFEDLEVPPFNIFVNYLYTRSVPANTDDWAKISTAKKWKIELVELKALVIADRFDAPDLLRLINNDLVASRVKHAPYYELVIYAFANLPESSPMLKLMVDAHCLHWEPKTDENDKEELELRPDLPHEFLVKVMIRYAELKEEKEKIRPLVKCDYHLHANDEEKRKCTK